ncbi:MAG: SPOR domain-containing protein [Planctomycetes bacterium]|nr:SPOR domain-containing protein [Planctomycetota bacterium]
MWRRARGPAPRGRRAANVFPPRSPQGDGVFPPRSPQRDEAAPGARRLPLWSPQFPRILPLTAGGGQGLAGLPEIRNVQGPAAPPGTPAGASSPAGGEPAEAAAPAAPPSPYHYRIQVRAKESWTGAQRILEYLETFGFQDGYLETDARGDTGSDGKPLYTVFVGHFFDERDAQEECDRLKRETRQRPYKSRGRFFEDSLVLRRQR